MKLKKSVLMLQKFFFALTILLYISTYSHAQVLTGDDIPPFDYSNPVQYEIQDIEVSGGEGFDNNVIIQLTGLQEGAKVSLPGDAISQATQKLWNHLKSRVSGHSQLFH